jgi:4-hydroxy-tetrahydrodipicolinate reductase
MGRRVVALAAADPEISVVAALESPECPRIGEDAGAVAGIGRLDVPLAAALEVATLEIAADVMVDFSLPAGTDAAVALCTRSRLPLIVATTGLDDGQTARLHTAAERIPLLWAPNMSLAVNLTMKLARVAAEAMKDHDTDVEILERHHRFKEDAPSGTALRFGRLIAEVMGQTEHRHGRHGRPGQREHDEIGYHAIRVGDNPGEHTIVFATLGEMVELTVRATNRDCYVQGALAAARFLVGRPAGLYGMDDVLGL